VRSLVCDRVHYACGKRAESWNGCKPGTSVSPDFLKVEPKTLEPGTPVLYGFWNGAGNTRTLDAERGREHPGLTAVGDGVENTRTPGVCAGREHPCFCGFGIRSREHSRYCGADSGLDRLAPGRYIFRGPASEWWPRAATFANA